MQIFVLRHGQAEPQQTTDEARNLTAQGRADVAAMIRRSQTDLLQVEVIWSSSLVRARQTAQIASDILARPQLQIDITDLIVPEGDIFSAVEALQNAKVNSILLASHQPFVGHFINTLCGTAPGFYSMDTSSLACIDCELVGPGMGQLRWLRHSYE